MIDNYCIAVDLGGTNVRGAIVKADGSIVKKHKTSTNNDPLNALFCVIDTLKSEFNHDLQGISIAVAGLVDNKKGLVINSPNIPTLNNLALRDIIADKYSCFCTICNDANAATLGEHFVGAAKGFRSFVLLTLGTGVGGGVVINNKLLDVAAEVGHICINIQGNQCACGNIGCLETYASATAIIQKTIKQLEQGVSSKLRELHHGNFYRLSAEDIYKMALEGDNLSRNVLREAGKCLGIGIANLINIFSPEAIILSGGLIGAWNIYIESAIAETSRRALSQLFSNTKILPSTLNDNAGIYGAVALLINL